MEIINIKPFPTYRKGDSIKLDTGEAFTIKEEYFFEPNASCAGCELQSLKVENPLCDCLQKICIPYRCIFSRTDNFVI